METMFEQCRAAGEDRCLPVRYEHLVLDTEEEMRKLLYFLELQWDPAVLHHEELIGKAGGVSLSKSVLPPVCLCSYSLLTAANLCFFKFIKPAKYIQ